MRDDYVEIRLPSSDRSPLEYLLRRVLIAAALRADRRQVQSERHQPGGDRGAAEATHLTA